MEDLQTEKEKVSKANYIIFHPDYARQQVSVLAESIVNNRLNKNWSGNIWVDAVGIGNEDPYVFHDGWLYSYCHASQLRRQPSNNYLQPGSWLVFCSGDKANDGILCVDTVFQIGSAHEWIRKPNLAVPLAFKKYFKLNRALWKSHFAYPLQKNGPHQSVTHTYEAILGASKSFLPLYKGERVCLDFDRFPNTLSKKISQNVRGKYPVNLTDDEVSLAVNGIRQKCDTQVLRIISASHLPKTINKVGC